MAWPALRMWTARSRYAIRLGSRPERGFLCRHVQPGLSRIPPNRLPGLHHRFIIRIIFPILRLLRLLGRMWGKIHLAAGFSPLPSFTRGKNKSIPTPSTTY
jgi:hypothetical protein